MKGGFNQFRVKEEHRDKTSFTWNGCQYRFRGAPFGFKHIPSIFQKVMAYLFQDHCFVLVYIDDIIIFSSSFEEHVKHLQIVMNLLNKVNLKVNPEKCDFGKLELIILGYLISAKIHIDSHFC